MMVRSCTCLNLNNLSLTNLTTVPYFLDYENEYEKEDGMLRRVVSKMKHLQTAFVGFKVLEEVPFFSYNLADDAVVLSIYAYNCSLHNMHGSLDFENEGGMLRRVVSKLEPLQAAFGGFNVPEEVPFFPPKLPEEWSATDPNAAMSENPLVLDPAGAALNYNSKLWSFYNLGILSHMNLKLHNDGRQGSALICDASCIQAISKRVHWGKFLAKAKFQRSPEKFKQVVEAQDVELLNDSLMCHEHRDGAAERYVQMANVTGDKQLALAANFCLCLILPFAEAMEQDYIVAKLSGLSLVVVYTMLMNNF